MAGSSTPAVRAAAEVPARRTAVLRSAIGTFARLGFRKTSMDQIATDADISRPGLYFLFSSKQALFRDAVDLALIEDLADAEDALRQPGAPLAERLLRAFDCWAGRYIGPLDRDVPTLIDDNLDLMGSTAREAPDRFAHLIIEALESDPARRDQSASTADALEVAETLISASIGVKHQVDERREYRDRMAVAIQLVVQPCEPGSE